MSKCRLTSLKFKLRINWFAITEHVQGNGNELERDFFTHASWVIENPIPRRKNLLFCSLFTNLFYHVLYDNHKNCSTVSTKTLKKVQQTHWRFSIFTLVIIVLSEIIFPVLNFKDIWNSIIWTTENPDVKKKHWIRWQCVIRPDLGSEMAISVIKWNIFHIFFYSTRISLWLKISFKCYLYWLIPSLPLFPYDILWPR